MQTLIIYTKNEWDYLCQNVNVAFSRDDNIRVPQLLARDQSKIYDYVVKQKGCFFISGSAKRMPADVRETLTQIISRQGNISRDEAVQVIKEMERERRYIVEAWS